MSKGKLLKGTAILTIVGVMTRLLGFIYKIFLSNILGTENLGVYQLIFPVYSVCYNIYATGIQTTISQFVAGEQGKKNNKNTLKVLRIGLLFSVGIAVVLSFIVFFNADYIAGSIIYEPRIAPSLRILSLVFPFCGATSCINGYYYGLTKSNIPATTQLIEQIVRVSIVYAMALLLGNGDLSLTVEMAVLGLVLGEITSTVYNIISYNTTYDTRQIRNNAKRSTIMAKPSKQLTKSMLKVSIPLTSNRLIISVLISMEAILIPSMLRKYGLSNTEALSIYGVISVMVKPFIMFPSTVTNSLSVLLLPTISEASATNNKKSIRTTTSLSIKYSLLVGILSTGVFLFFGKELGLVVFNNALAGDYIRILAWLCPFLYIGSTFTSILNGINKLHISFFSSVSGLSVRILLILLLVSKNGIYGYFVSLLVSLLIGIGFEFFVLYKNIDPQLDSVDIILKPGLIVLVSGYFIKAIYNYLKINHSGLMLLGLACLFYFLIYMTFLWLTNVIRKQDFK